MNFLKSFSSPKCFVCFLVFFSLRAQIANGQEKDRAELMYTEQLSKKFPDSAFLLLKEMYGRSIEQKDRITTGICLQQMGQICYYLGSYPKALDFHLQADKIFRSEKKQELIAANLNDMGILYYYNRQMSTARTRYEEALSIYDRAGNGEGRAVTYGKIGHLYEKQHRYDSAFYFQRLALLQYNKISHKQGVAKIYENIGSIYEDLEQYDSSYFYFSGSLQMYELANDEVGKIEVLNNLGDILRKTAHYSSALEMTNNALALALKTGDLYEQGAAYRDLGKTYNLLRQNDSAYHYLELSRRSTIDIYSIENNRQTAFLSVLFDIDKKNAEIVSLENERHVNTIIGVSVTVVTALLAVLAWVTISRQRLKIRNEQKISETNRKIYQAEHELMQSELENKKLQEEKLIRELEAKRKGLTSYTLHVIQKNQLLEELRTRLEDMVKEERRDQKKQLQFLIHQINVNFNHDQYWNEFREIFEQLHQQFFDSLRKHSGDLTGNDLRLVALIKLNLSSKDVATLLGISQDSLRVSRYRLRKKLNLEQGESLTNFIQSL